MVFISGPKIIMRSALAKKMPPAASLANLKPAKPGEVRNPHGRPKTPEDVKQALAAMLPAAVKRLGELLLSDNEKIAVQAVQVVLDRNLGKAIATKIDVKADMGQLHLQLLEEIRARRQERIGGQAPMVDVTPKEGGTQTPYETAAQNVNKSGPDDPDT